MKDERSHLQLFDLIAREWMLPAMASQVVFNADGSAVAFACSDGSVHLAATADKGSPNKRVKRAVDDARLTITPRKVPVLPLKRADFTAGRSTAIIPFGATNFAFAMTTGRINSLTPGGIAVHLSARAPCAVVALAATSDGATLAFACGHSVHVQTTDGERALAIDTPAPATMLAFSPDAEVLAAATGQAVTCWPVADLRDPIQTRLPDTAVAVEFGADGKWLLCRLETDGLALVDASTGVARCYGQFPAPVRSACFHAPTGTVLASGAFRVAGWSLDAEKAPVVSGRSGLMLIDAVAASPNRNLAAVGYANGLVSLTEIGKPGEMLLRENTGAGVAAMAWSPDGAFLAISGTDGSAALVEFPDSMFKG